MSQPDLQNLLDRAAISDVVHAYATGLDRRDWALYRSIFTNDLEMDYASIGIEPGTFDADKWVRASKRLFLGFTATQHTSSNHVHHIRGDTATCVSNMQAEHFIAPEPGREVDERDLRWTIGGYYENELVRTPEGWKLCGVALRITWQQGNRDVPGIAMKLGRARLKAEEASR